MAEREEWSARMGFWCAAIGSAVGLGNVWRFPNYSYAYGGGAFFIPFLGALLLIGIPLLTLEFSLGQVFRSGDVVSFGAMHKRLRGVGLGSVWCGYMAVCYYVLIIAWAITMLVNCFRGSEGSFVWSTFEGGTVNFFLKEVVGLADVTNADGTLNRSMNIVPQTWAGITFIWLAIYLCTFKGAKLTGRITYLTMTVPLLLLLFLAIFFSTLEGSEDGIELYIGKWDLSQLTGSEPKCAGGSKGCQEAWPDAVAQVFFSLSITFGVMTAYASYNPSNQGVMADAIFTGFGDVFASFIAGFTVFAALGAYTHVQEVAAAATHQEQLDAGLESIAMTLNTTFKLFDDILSPSTLTTFLDGFYKTQSVDKLEDFLTNVSGIVGSSNMTLNATELMGNLPERAAALSAASGSGGLGLVFWTLPGAFEALGGAPFNMGMGTRMLLAFLFYLTIVLLGIDSAFSLCEGCSTCMKDSRLFKGVRQEVIIAVICGIGYTISVLVYATDIGLYMLDTVDYYINVLMLFVGYMECVSVGWVAYSSEQIEKIGKPAYLLVFGSMVASSVLAPYIGFGIGGQSDEAEAGTVVGLMFGFVLFAMGTGGSCYLAKQHGSTSAVYDTLLFNIETLREKLNEKCGAPVGNLSIPMLWSLLIKFFIPPVLMCMLMLKLRSPAFGAYEGYPGYYQFWGMAIILVPLAIFVMGMMKPELLDIVMPEEESTLDSLFQNAIQGGEPESGVSSTPEEKPTEKPTTSTEDDVEEDTTTAQMRDR